MAARRRGLLAPLLKDYFMVPISRYSILFPEEAGTIDHLLHAQDGGFSFFPSTHHFLEGILLAVLLSILRVILDYLLFIPLGKSAMKLKTHYVKAYLPELEAEFAKNKLLTQAQLDTLCKATRLSTVEISAYFRARRMEARETKKLVKFKEACWRDFLYITGVVLSFLFIRLQSWFVDIKDCWRSYPLQELPESVMWYYMFQFGMYVHLFIYQFSDTKRSDFWEMFVHHLATIALIVFSWLSCFVRIGTLVMMIHDPSDVFLETAKIFNYTSRARPWAQVLTDRLFVCFALTFAITRLGIFPFWIIRSTLTDAHLIIAGHYGGYYPAMYMFYGMLCILQVLHVFWFYLIARMAVKMIISGKVEKDVRSDDDSSEVEDDSSEEDEDTKKIAHKKKAQ